MTPKAVPREKIPWFPSIEADQCTGCWACIEFCPHGVYTRDEEDKIVRVEHPYQCVVGCSNCRGLCAPAAISFPDLEEITEIIRALRWEANNGS